MKSWSPQKRATASSRSTSAAVDFPFSSARPPASVEPVLRAAEFQAFLQKRILSSASKGESSLLRSAANSTPIDLFLPCKLPSSWPSPGNHRHCNYSRFGQAITPSITFPKLRICTKIRDLLINRYTIIIVQIIKEHNAVTANEYPNNARTQLNVISCNATLPYPAISLSEVKR